MKHVEEINVNYKLASGGVAGNSVSYFLLLLHLKFFNLLVLHLTPIYYFDYKSGHCL